MIFIVAIPAIGIIIYSGIKSRNDAIDDARRETYQLVDKLTSEQQNLVSAAEQLLITLAQLPDVRNHRTAKIQPILRSLHQINAWYSNIFVADRDGNVWAQAVDAKPFSILDRRYFLNARASGRFSSGEYVLSRATGKTAFNFAYPMKDEHDALSGVVNIGIKMPYFEHILERFPMTPGTRYILIDHRGIVLGSSTGSEQISGKGYDPDSFRIMNEGPEVNTFKGISSTGEMCITTYRKLRLPGELNPYIYIRAEIPLKTVLTESSKVLAANMALLSSFVLLAVAFAWFVGNRSIADRIRLLENASRRLADGDLEVRVSTVVTGGELGQLSQTFDTMAQRLMAREEALVESERNYREIFNTTKDAIFVHDGESGNIIEINKTVEELYGYSREEILHHTVQDLSSGDPPYSLQDAFNWMGKTMQEGPQSFEWLAKKKNGELFWTEVVLSATRIGGAGRVLAVVRDITSRRRTEEALRERDERLRQAVRISQIGIFDHDQRTDTIYWSPQQRLIHGWGPDEPVTLQSFLDLLHPEDHDMIAAAVRKAHDPAGDGIWDVEHRIIHRDGTTRWLKERSQTFFEGKGVARRPVRTIGAVIDITERKKMEEDQQKLVSVIEMSRDFISIADLEGRILYVNSAGMNVVGLDGIADSRTKSIQEFLLEADQRRLQVDILPAVFGTGSWTGELALRHFKTGIPIPVEMNAFIIKDTKSDQPIALANISRDITERKHAEEEKQRLQAQLFQSQKMESIGQLAGGVAHDFNNILSAIIGYGNILQMKMPATDPLRINVDHMLESADRAAQLTHSLLAFSRKQVMNMKPVRLNEILARQERFLRRIIGEDIDMKTIFHRNPVIMADSGQVEQVLMNLATNARDAMPKGGNLTIETDLTAMTATFVIAHGFGTPGTYALISVTDTGLGMDEETQRRIFEPFFTTKEVGRGTGLGMAIIYGIVKQHNGYINAYSQVGKGTTFKIYLPVHSGEVEQPERSLAASPAMAGTETLLLAEDDAVLRTFFKDILTEYGYTVIVAENGEDAIRKFSERKDEIQLIIVDMIMPKQSGREVFEVVQKMKPGTKVIFSSGYTADKVQQEGLPAGSEFIAKPSSPQKYLSKIRDVLDGYHTL